MTHFHFVIKGQHPSREVLQFCGGRCERKLRFFMSEVDLDGELIENDRLNIMSLCTMRRGARSGRQGAWHIVAMSFLLVTISCLEERKLDHTAPEELLWDSIMTRVCHTEFFSCQGQCGESTMVVNSKTDISRACSCDKFCLMFQDCCWDFHTSCPEEHAAFEEWVLEKYNSSSSPQTDCINGAAVISGCSPDCQGTTETSDDPTFLTDLDTGFSYQNMSIFLCNSCNGAKDSARLQVWTAVIEVNDLDNDAMESLIDLVETGRFSEKIASAVVSRPSTETVTRGCQYYFRIFCQSFSEPASVTTDICQNMSIEGNFLFIQNDTHVSSPVGYFYSHSFDGGRREINAPFSPVIVHECSLKRFSENANRHGSGFSVLFSKDSVRSLSVYENNFDEAIEFLEVFCYNAVPELECHPQINCALHSLLHDISCKKPQELVLVVRTRNDDIAILEILALRSMKKILGAFGETFTKQLVKGENMSEVALRHHFPSFTTLNVTAMRDGFLDQTQSFYSNFIKKDPIVSVSEVYLCVSFMLNRSVQELFVEDLCATIVDDGKVVTVDKGSFLSPNPNSVNPLVSQNSQIAQLVIVGLLNQALLQPIFL